MTPPTPPGRPARLPRHPGRAASPSGSATSRALRGIDLDVARRHRARTARPERRRQDDRRPHPHDHPPGRRAAGPRCSASTSPPNPPAARADHRPRRAVRRRRREPDRPREPAPGRPPDPPPRAAGGRPGRRAARPVRAGRRRRPARPRPTRVACGAASTSRPPSSTARPVLFLDEPTTGLDPASRSDLWQVIDELVADGHDRAAHDPVPRGGRPPGRPHRGHRPGPGHRRGHARRAQGAARRHGHPHRPRRPAPRRCGPRPRSATPTPSRRASTGATLDLTVDDGAPHASSRCCAPSTRAGLEPAGVTVREPSLDDVFLTLTGHRAEPDVPDDGAATPAPTPARCRMTTATLPSPAATAVARRGACSRSRPRRPRRGRRPHDDVAQPAHLRAGARDPRVLDDPAGDVRAAVPLRVRQLDHAVRPVDPLRRLPDGRHHRADRAVRIGRHRHRPRRGPEQGAHRAVPVAADGALRGAGRADDGRGGAQRRRPRPHHRRRAWPSASASTAACPRTSAPWRLVLLFAFAFSWVVATVGLGAPSGEAAQAAIFPMLFPLVFASSAFVDTSFMPGWLQAFADHQPVTVTVDAARAPRARPARRAGAWSGRSPGRSASWRCSPRWRCAATAGRDAGTPRRRPTCSPRGVARGSALAGHPSSRGRPPGRLVGGRRRCGDGRHGRGGQARRGRPRGDDRSAGRTGWCSRPRPGGGVDRRAGGGRHRPAAVPQRATASRARRSNGS